MFKHGLPRRRKVYDHTGDLNDAEELSGQNSEDLYSYYRDLYRKVTEADIEQFAADFRGSDEEAAELLQYYERFQGDMKQVQGDTALFLSFLVGFVVITETCKRLCLLCRCLSG